MFDGPLVEKWNMWMNVDLKKLKGKSKCAFDWNSINESKHGEDKFKGWKAHNAWMFSNDDVKGWNCGPYHYCPLGDKTRGIRSTPYYFSKKLLSLVYIITITQIVGKESYKEKWGK
jgi:hypothetical protein